MFIHLTIRPDRRDVETGQITPAIQRFLKRSLGGDKPPIVSRFEGNQFQPNQEARPPELSHQTYYSRIYHVPYVGDGVHGVPKPDVGLCPQVPHGGIPWNNIDNFGQQVDDSLVILMLEMAICLLKPLLNMLDKASVMI